MTRDDDPGTFFNVSGHIMLLSQERLIECAARFMRLALVACLWWQEASGFA